MLRKVQSRAFAGAADNLGIDESGALTSAEINGVSAVLDLASYQSLNLTVEDYMIRRGTTVGSGSFESFPYFDMDDITFPDNAWVLDMSCISIAGPATACLVTMGVGPAVAGTRLVKHWTTTVNPGVGGVCFIPDGLSDYTFPFPLTRQVPTAMGQPSLVSGDAANPFQMEINGAGAGNVSQFTTRIRSAPEGVRVWGT
mgnify:CR=1 FL=1